MEKWIIYHEKIKQLNPDNHAWALSAFIPIFFPDKPKSWIYKIVGHQGRGSKNGIRQAGSMCGKMAKRGFLKDATESFYDEKKGYSVPGIRMYKWVDINKK